MLKERLILVLEDVINKLPDHFMCGGICDVLREFECSNLISRDEQYYIITFLNRNRPTSKNKYKEFTENNFWCKPNNIACYWWNPMFEYEKTIQIRIDYLKKVIELNK